MLWIFSNPFIVFEGCPCNTFFELHYARLSVAGALREERHCVAATEGFDSPAEKGLAILVLAVYRYISCAVKDFAQHGIREKTRWVDRSAYNYK